MTDRLKKPNTRDLAKAASRAKVLDAARGLFTTIGYDATTLRMVANLAGLSTGAVFVHVEDKEDLWRQAMGGPAPSVAIAEQIALVMAQLPGWSWSVGRPAQTGDTFTASVRSPDFNPSVVNQGRVFAGEGYTPASALALARHAALPHAGTAPHLKAVA